MVDIPRAHRCRIVEMAEVMKKLLITNPDPSIMLHLCRLCGRYSWNMTSIFDITNKYDYSKVINLHFRDFNVGLFDYEFNGFVVMILEVIHSNNAFIDHRKG